MPHCLKLPSALAAWKVRIFDNEVRETPHATIVKGTQKWRINLRTGKFMDSRPSPQYVDRCWPLSRTRWKHCVRRGTKCFRTTRFEVIR